MIIEEIKDSLKIAMKSSNKSEVLAIRNILEKIKKFEVDNKLVATENDVQKILSKYAKQLKDSIEQFKNGNRLDLVKKEEAEFKIVARFLPKQLSEKEIAVIIDKVIKKLNASNVSDMGNVIKNVMKETKGAADGKIISTIVREKLM
tara:strand:+ start:764 stop:1204 length:441 start_codon:yes stop_codon:yes gene_type:complete